MTFDSYHSQLWWAERCDLYLRVVRFFRSTFYLRTNNKRVFIIVNDNSASVCLFNPLATKVLFSGTTVNYLNFWFYHWNIFTVAKGLNIPLSHILLLRMLNHWSSSLGYISLCIIVCYIDPQLMSKMASLIGKKLTEKIFLDRYIALCKDKDIHVRKVCASHFGEICVAVRRKAFLQKLVSLLCSRLYLFTTIG